MLLRRCQHLFVELDQEPRFVFQTLLAGGDGLDRSPRWLAYAAHLDEPVPVDLAQLALLQAVSRDDWADAKALHQAHGEAAVQALLAELVTHVPVKQAAALVAEVLGLPRKALYDDALRLRQAQDAAE